MLSAQHPIPGSGTAVSAGSYVHEWTHGLGTATPQLALFQLVDLSPATWRFVPPNEWDARCTLTTLTLTLASTPPTAGNVGALKLCALAPDVAPSNIPGRSGGICSALQLNALRARASAIIAGTFPTVVSIADRTEIPAARWSLNSGVEHELAGLMPSPDVSIRVERVAISGLTIVAGRTTLTEDGRTMRITRIRDAKGDPGIVLECKAV